jgi:hypothetical protein
MLGLVTFATIPKTKDATTALMNARIRSLSRTAWLNWVPIQSSLAEDFVALPNLIETAKPLMNSGVSYRARSEGIRLFSSFLTTPADRSPRLDWVHRGALGKK